MRPASGDISLVCSLTDAEFRKREATLLTEFKSMIVAIAELSDGYAFQLPADGQAVSVVVEWVLAERECCPFFKFELTAEPNHGAFTFKITGPVGTKDFLKAMFAKAEPR